MLRARESGEVENFQLLVSSLPFVVKKVDGTPVISFPCEASVYNSFWFTGNEQWHELEEVELEHGNEDYHYIASATNDSGLSYDWIWCNESIRDDSNNVVYTGSVPHLIGEYIKQSFLNGLAAVLCSKARTLAPMCFYGHIAKEGEEPSYGSIKRTINGVDYVGMVTRNICSFYTTELQKQYPYIFISHNFLNIIATLSTSAVYWTDESETYREELRAVESGSRISFIFKILTGTEWQYNEGAEWTFESNGMVDYAYFRNGFDWTNHDIPKADGTLYLAASEPIPFYE